MVFASAIARFWWSSEFHESIPRARFANVRSEVVIFPDQQVGESQGRETAVVQEERPRTRRREHLYRTDLNRSKLRCPRERRDSQGHPVSKISTLSFLLDANRWTRLWILNTNTELMQRSFSEVALRLSGLAGLFAEKQSRYDTFGSESEPG